MCSLSIFPSPPATGLITFCEAEGRLISDTSEPAEYCSYLDQAHNYANIVITAESVRPTVSKHSLKNTFIQKDLNFWKKVVRAWYETGNEGVLRELAISSGTGALAWLRYISTYLLPVYKWLQAVNRSIYPHLTMPKEDVIVEFSVALKWHEYQIQCFAWHPQTMKCAVALVDDSVKVYGYASGITPILKHKNQKLITDLAWKPYCASVLGVACSNGIVIWRIDPTSLVTRPSSACLTLLTSSGHTCVTSISWHPDGTLLASASPTDACMLIWDIEREIGVPLRRVSGGGVSFVRWAPNGIRLFAATPSHLFRVWETQTWTCEKWTKLWGRVQCACWSPCGKHLLLAMHGEPMIFRLSFEPDDVVSPFEIGGMKNAIPLVDVSQTLLSSFHEDEEFKVGGCIQSMLWNKTGERLVVSFKDNPEFVALFCTKTQPNVDISPCGFIRGYPEEMPQVMNFHDDFQDGALLTICWTSGRITHLPMFFSTSPNLLNLSSKAVRQFSAGHNPILLSPQ